MNFVEYQNFNLQERDIISRSTPLKCYYIVPTICILTQLLSIGLISWVWIDTRNFYFHELQPNLEVLEKSLLTNRNLSYDLSTHRKKIPVSGAMISQIMRHSVGLLNGMNMKCDGLDGTKDLWIPGQPGHPGIRGPEGSAGEPGEIGPIGPKGEQGWPGFPGYPGASGPQGNQGQVGAMGDKGAQGPITIGPPGQNRHQYQGDTGQKGDTGPPGFPGLPGPQGVKGDSGLFGLIGQKGEPGQKGELGPGGTRGTKGQRGFGLV